MVLVLHGIRDVGFDEFLRSHMRTLAPKADPPPVTTVCRSLIMSTESPMTLHLARVWVLLFERKSQNLTEVSQLPE